MRKSSDSGVSLGELLGSNKNKFRFLDFRPADQLTILLFQAESPGGLVLKSISKFCD